MASVNKGGAAKVAAARSEVKGGKRHFTFAGVNLTGPAKLPGSFSFDLLELEATDDASIAYKLVTSVIGDEGFRSVRDAAAKKRTDDGGATLFRDLLVTIATAYGTDQGE